MRQMEEEKQRETKESQEEVGQAGDADPQLKKKKKDKKPIKGMTKEERQRHSEELKAERKAKALQWKKAKEEKEQEREEHKAVLKRAKELLSRTESTSTVVCAEDVPSILESLPEPSMSRQTDPLEISLVGARSPTCVPRSF